MLKSFLAYEPQEYMPQAGFTSEYSFLNRDLRLGHFETEHDIKHNKNQLNTCQEFSKPTAKFSH